MKLTFLVNCNVTVSLTRLPSIISNLNQAPHEANISSAATNPIFTQSITTVH